jgi:WD40 repeat protein
MDVWDLAKGRLRAPVRAPAEAVLNSAWRIWHFGFHADGQHVFLAEVTGKISVWEAASGKLARSFALPGYATRANTLRFCVGAPKGDTVLINRGMKRLRLVEWSSNKDVWESSDLTARGICSSPIYSRDGKRILVGVITYEDKPYTELRGKLELVRLDAANGKVVDRTALKSNSTGGTTWFEQPKLDSDGRTLLLAYGAAEVFVADAVVNRELHHHNLFLSSPALSPDGKWIIGGFLDSIDVHDAATGKKLLRLPIGDHTVHSLEVLPDGRHVFTTGPGGRAYLWDLKEALPAKGGKGNGD